MNVGFCSGKLLKLPLASTPQSTCNLQLKGEEFISKLLDRRWALLNPETNIHQIAVPSSHVHYEGGLLGKTKFIRRACPSMAGGMIQEKSHNPSFYVVRDDLLHPLVNGNKARKLDALLPLVEDYSVTDVITCGGCQSAHAAAVAVSCAERGLRSHLLLRGEQPKILTGYNLISKMYGNVTYVPRSEYANREEMLKRHANLAAGNDGSVVWFSDILEDSFSFHQPLNTMQTRTYEDAESLPRKVVIVNEGAGDAIALLGVIRLVQYLSQKHLFGRQRSLKFIVDAGTGTTAVGLGLGALCLGLPWEICAVMLADTMDGYKEQEKHLISDFKKYYASDLVDNELNGLDGGVVNWVERSHPRKFGNVLEGEVETCQQIAQQTGILVDPIYTLAAWEMATVLSRKEAAEVVMLHTGGTLGMFGLAQRYRSYF